MAAKPHCKCQVGVVWFQDHVREVFLVVLHLLNTDFEEK